MISIYFLFYQFFEGFMIKWLIYEKINLKLLGKRQKNVIQNKFNGFIKPPRSKSLSYKT